MADKIVKRTMVELEDGVIVKMALTAPILQAFPFLAPIAKATRDGAGGGCGKCGKAATDRTKLFQQTKLTIAGMSTEQKRKLKDFMNAGTMRVTYRDAAGKIQQLTF